jgi:hypothetical protein
MKTFSIILARWKRWLTLGLLLASAAAPASTSAQDWNIKIGPPSAEERDKAAKEILAKLPADQAAAYLKHQHAWDAATGVLEWTATLALPVAIVALVLSFRHRRLKLAHESMRLMIEKGLPVPAELITPPSRVRPIQSDLRRGLVWLALGLGLAFALARLFAEEGASLWTLGLIPAFIGAAYLTSWAVGLLQRQPLNSLWAGAILVALGITTAVAFASSVNVQIGDKTLDDFANLGLLPVALGGALLFGPMVKALADIKSASPWPGILWTTLSAAALLVFRLRGLEGWLFWLIPLAIGLAYLTYLFAMRKAEHRKPAQG